VTNILIERRFCGPATSGNGGYSSGRLAALIDGPAEVTLRAPPPLESELALEGRDEGAVMLAPDGTVIAEAKPTTLDLVVPPAVSFEEAERASARYIGFSNHPYPSCFVCGPSRPAELGAGLELFAGALEARDDGSVPRVAAPFRPAEDLCDEHGLLRDAFVWSALDCPSWFGHAAFLDDVPPILLGRLAVEVVRHPTARERCVVQGWSLGQEGRRILCGSALYGEDGDLLARARATWVTLKQA
jgi:hypothetical protein